MKTSATNRKLRLLLTGIQNGSLVPRPEFQRRLVWLNKHKVAFLQTVLEGLPFPEIYIAAGDVNSETGEGQELLVDGQQRISTLYQYFKASPDLKLDKSLPSYKELTEEMKVAFLEYEVVVRDLGAIPVPEILEVFKRINSTNYALNTMEVHNARFDGCLKQLAEEIASNHFFETNHFFTSQDLKRMGDTRFCLSVLVSVMGGYFNRDEALEAYLEKYNDELDRSEELKAQLEWVVDFITRCNPDPSSRLWKKADMFSVMIEIHRARFKRNIGLDASLSGSRLIEFLDGIDALDEFDNSSEISVLYYRAALQATNDRGNRIRRGEIIQSILDPSYEPVLSTTHLDFSS